MARRERHTKIGGQFSARLIEMLESCAWQATTLAARKVLDRLEIEHAHHGGTDNGRLPVTYADFIAFGIERKTVPLAIRETEALGFVVVMERGRGGNAEYRSPSLYRLTYRHTKDAKPTNDWRRIQTVAEAKRIVKEIRKRSREKQKTRREKPHVSGGKNPSENRKSRAGNSRLQVQGGNTRPLSILSVGVTPLHHFIRAVYWPREAKRPKVASERSAAFRRIEAPKVDLRANLARRLGDLS